MEGIDCELCNQQFSTEEELIAHKNQSHSEFTEMYGNEDRGTDAILDKVSDITGGETDEQNAEKPEDDLILPPKDKSKPWYGRGDLPAEENDEVETGWIDPDSGELVQKRPDRLHTIGGKSVPREEDVETLTEVAKYIRGYAKENDFEVLDFFSPPEEDDWATCDLCGEKYPGGDTEGMKSHLINQHISTIKESKRKAKEIGSIDTPQTPQVDTPQTPQISTPEQPETGATEETDDYEVDVDEYLKTSEPVQKLPEDKRVEEGGQGSGPQGGSALLPEQSAMKNINPEYDPFKATPRSELLQTDPDVLRTTEDAPVEDEEEKLKRLEEVWYKVSKETRAKIFESLGITQGDAYILAGLEYQYITEAVKKDIVKEAEDYFNEDEDKLEKYSRVNEEDEEEEKELNEAYSFTYDLENNHKSRDFKKKDLTCTRCNESFYDNNDRNVHFNEVHMNANEYELPDQCPFCDEIIKEPETLDWHMQQDHGAHVSSQYTQTGIQGAMADADDFGLDQDFYSEARSSANDWELEQEKDSHSRYEDLISREGQPPSSVPEQYYDKGGSRKREDWILTLRGFLKYEFDQGLIPQSVSVMFGESKRKAKETVPSDDQVVQDWWQLISEAGGDGDYMSKAMVNGPDNSPNWESGDPIMWSEFSSSQQQALINAAGGIGGMIERLMNEGWSDYNDEDEDSYESVSNIVNESRAGDLKKEIKKLQKFINIASFENPMNMGDDQAKLESLQAELASLGEARATEKGETYIFMWRKMDENMRKDMLRSTWNSEYEVASYKGTDWEQLPTNVQEDLKVKMNELFRESAHDGESYAKEEDQEWEELVRDARLEIHPDAEHEPEEFPEKKGEEGDPLELGFKHNDPVPKSGINKQLGGIDQAHMYAKGQAKQARSDLMGDPEGYDWQKGGEKAEEGWDSEEQFAQHWDQQIDSGEGEDWQQEIVQDVGDYMNNYGFMKWAELPQDLKDKLKARAFINESHANEDEDEQRDMMNAINKHAAQGKSGLAGKWQKIPEPWEYGGADYKREGDPEGDKAEEDEPKDKKNRLDYADKMDQYIEILREEGDNIEPQEFYESLANELNAPEIFGHIVVTDPSSPGEFTAYCNHCSYETDSVYPKMKEHLKQAHDIAVESRANEDYIPEPYSQHFKWVASMDQDDYVCKHCGQMMMANGNALHTQPQNVIVDVVKQHLESHGITEAKAKEDFDFDAAEPARVKLLLDQYKSGEDWVSDPKRLESEDGSFEGWLSYSKKFNINDQDARKAWSGEAKDRPVVEGDPVETFSQQCFDWEGHEIDCESGKIIGDGYSKSKAYNKFLNENFSKLSNEGMYDWMTVQHLPDKPGMSDNAWVCNICGEWLEGNEAPINHLATKHSDVLPKEEMMHADKWSEGPTGIDSGGFSMLDKGGKVRDIDYDAWKDPYYGEAKATEQNPDKLLEDLMDEDGNPPDELGVDDAISYLTKMGVPEDEAKDAVKRFGGDIG